MHSYSTTRPYIQIQHVPGVIEKLGVFSMSAWEVGHIICITPQTKILGK